MKEIYQPCSVTTKAFLLWEYKCYYSNTSHSHLGKNDFILEPNVSGRGPGMWIQVTLNNICHRGSGCIRFCCLQNKAGYKSSHLPNVLAETACRMVTASRGANCAVGITCCLVTFITLGSIKGLLRIFAKTVIVIHTKVGSE